MKNKMLSLLLAVVMTMGLVAGCGEKEEAAAPAETKKEEAAETPEAAPEGAIAAKYSVTFPATGTQADSAHGLGKFIEEESEGRIVMEFYPASQLGDKIASMEGMINGTIEMSEFAATDFSNYDDMWSVFALPYLWDNADQAIGTLSDPKVAEFLNANAEQYGMKIIAWQNLGSRSILNSKRPVNNPEELKGITVRCMQDPILAGAMNAMGASATPLPWGECYTALQQGTIDGVENSTPVLLANGMQEVAPYLSLTEQFIIPDPVVISKVWFDGLSADDQAAILSAGEKFTEWYNTELWPNAEAECLDALVADGVQVNEVDKAAFKAAVQPVVDDFLAKASDSQKELYALLNEVRVNY